MNIKNKYKKEQILGFKEYDWNFKISSGYSGYENINSSNNELWIYQEDYMNRKALKERYDYEYKLLSEFVDDHLNRDTISNYAISDFLSEKYFK